jgi:TRAP transporter TAXI family solute receptor
MRRKRKIILLFIGISLFSVTISTAPGLAASTLIPVYTPPTGGTGYILGAGIASVTKKYLPGVELVVEPLGGGTVAIVKMLMEKETMKRDAFGVFAADGAFNAFKGQKEFAGKPYPNLRAVTFLWGADLYLVVPTNSPIRSYSDLKGKRVGMGGAGGTVSLTALYLLELHGVKREDFKPYFFVYKETIEGIKDGSLDAGFLGGGYPIAAYTEISLTHSVRIVPVQEEIIKKVTVENPYYYRGLVKANSYKGLEHDTPIIGFSSGLNTQAGVNEGLVYQITKNLFDHKEDYYQIHLSAREMTPETALKGIPIPFHPGAERYFKEAGILKR